MLQRPTGSAQFVSLAFGQKARDAGIAISMGSRGDAYDNAVAESFFATLKKELIRRRSWPSRRELIGEVFDYIETFYNHQRRHSTLGFLSPAAFELRASRSEPKTMNIKTNTTGLVDDLESLGLARRRPHPTDRRAKLVEATRKGKVMARRADAILGTPPPALSALSTADLEALRRILEKVAPRT